MRQAHGDLPRLEFRTGLAEEIPLESDLANKVICNGVLLCLKDRETVLRAVQELFRITRPGGFVWIGEVPDRDEQATLKFSGRGPKRFLGYLSYLKQSNGGVGRFHFLGRVLKLMKAWVSPGSLFIIHPKKTTFIESHTLIEFAKSQGAELVLERRHLGLGPKGNPKEVPTRMDYCFRKR